MTQKLWLEKPKLKYSKDVFDIVQFGSSVIEGKKPNDIDIAAIFNKIPIKEQLIQAQEIKKQLEKISDIPIHIKSFDLYSFFDEANFAKESILLCGRSIISGDFFSKRFGLNPRIQIYYYLKNLEKKDKIRFNYMLNGKKGKYGLLRKFNGRLLNPGVIELEPNYEDIFVSSIKKFNVDFKVKRVFSL